MPHTLALLGRDASARYDKLNHIVYTVNAYDRLRMVAALESARRKLEEPSEIETRLSYVDGMQNRLVYRGIDVGRLADSSTYEEVAYLLLHGALPTRKQLDDFTRGMIASRRLPAGIVTLIGALPLSAAPMDVLRTVISAMVMFDMKATRTSRDALLDTGIELIAQAPTIITAYHHIRNSRLPIEPDPDLGHAANFLYSLKGAEPDDEDARALDKCWVLHADHGLNASTFAARVTASAQSDIYAALTTAVATLKGTIHGGANQKVMEMLLEIKDERRVDDYVALSLKHGKRIPGFGHRVYRGEDPRVSYLRRLSETICRKNGHARWFDLSRQVEEAVLRVKGLHANMDFYSATLYYALGIPVDMFTAMFACSRMAGWTAHIIEQYELDRLIRPLGEYVGVLDQEYVPIEKRS